MAHDRYETPHSADKYGTPLEIERALKSLKISHGQGRATRKNKKDYGRPSVYEGGRRAFSWNDINRQIDTMRSATQRRKKFF